MRVLHLDSGREMRGGQWQVLRLLGGLERHGIEFTLLSPEGSALFEMAGKSRLPVEPLGFARILRLGRRYDLIHAHDARCHTLAALVAGKPLLVSRRVAFPIRSRWKYRRARRYIAVSEFVRSVLQKGGVHESRIAVVYDGVPLLEPSSGNYVVAPENAADEQKGEPLALEAARLAEVPLRLSSFLERDLREAAVFVYLSHSEGLGSAALLAMAAAVPVVASRVGGLPEIVRDGETGLLVENDPRAVATAIRRLLEDRALAARLGQAGRRAVEQQFTISHMVRRTMEVYRQVLT